MYVLVHRRAEVSLRSLDNVEQKRITRALDELSAANWTQLHKSPKLHKLKTGFSGKSLYTYHGSPKLRLILSVEGDTCTIEDVAHHDRLDRLNVNQRQG